MYNQILEVNNQANNKQTKRNSLANDEKIVKETVKLDVPEKNNKSNEIEKTSFNVLLNDNTFKSEAEFMKSVLVKTGVFQGCEKSLEDANDDLFYFHKDMIIDSNLRRPDYLCENVAEAVRLIYETEKFS